MSLHSSQCIHDIRTICIILSLKQTEACFTTDFIWIFIFMAFLTISVLSFPISITISNIKLFYFALDSVFSELHTHTHRKNTNYY